MQKVITITKNDIYVYINYINAYDTNDFVIFSYSKKMKCYFSCSIFGGFQCDVNIKAGDLKQDVCKKAVYELKQLLLQHKLIFLLEKLATIQYHIHHPKSLENIDHHSCLFLCDCEHD